MYNPWRCLWNMCLFFGIVEYLFMIYGNVFCSYDFLTTIPEWIFFSLLLNMVDKKETLSLNRYFTLEFLGPWHQRGVFAFVQQRHLHDFNSFLRCFLVFRIVISPVPLFLPCVIIPSFAFSPSSTWSITLCAYSYLFSELYPLSCYDLKLSMKDWII
jgi:hypothetical protein